MLFHPWGNLIKYTRTKDDASGGQKFKTGFHHHSRSSGKKLENFTLRRGSAIIGATASRQTG